MTYFSHFHNGYMFLWKETIKAYVLDSNDNTILEVNSGKSKNNIKVNKDDTYQVKIITEEHEGEFRISWKKEK
ncbi:hypothetical protein DT250_03850 [Bacillus sp. AR2-1]|nr:hypothetical protein DT250_03850 [Bacillus sp. AR2-1]